MGEKYFNVISPQALVFMLYKENKEVGRWFTNTLNIRTDVFDDSAILARAIDKIAKGKSQEGWGKIGSVVGGKTSLPIVPYKMAREVQNIVRGIEEKPLIKPNYQNKGFIEGYYQQGVVNYIQTLIDPNYNVKKPASTPSSPEKRDAMKEINKIKSDAQKPANDARKEALKARREALKK